MKWNPNQRERRVLLLGATIVAALVLYFIADSIYQGYEKLGEDINDKKKDLQDLVRLQTQYRQTHQQLEQIKAKLNSMGKGFSLLSFIEDLANKEGIRENIGSAKPKTIPMGDGYEERLVEVQMYDITLTKLVEFIYKIENAGHLLRVSRLRIKPRYDNRNLLQVTIQVSTYEKKS